MCKSDSNFFKDLFKKNKNYLHCGWKCFEIVILGAWINVACCCTVWCLYSMLLILPPKLKLLHLWDTSSWQRDRQTSTSWLTGPVWQTDKMSNAGRKRQTDILQTANDIWHLLKQLVREQTIRQVLAEQVSSRKGEWLTAAAGVCSPSP